VQIIRISNRSHVTKDEGSGSTAVETEVGEVWVAERIARGDRWTAKVVGIVASDCAFLDVVVCGWESASYGASVHRRLVYAREAAIGRDACRDVERVEGEIAGIVEGEQPAIDDVLSVGF
jgi:hypothetical protein